MEVSDLMRHRRCRGSAACAHRRRRLEGPARHAGMGANERQADRYALAVEAAGIVAAGWRVRVEGEGEGRPADVDAVAALMLHSRSRRRQSSVWLASAADRTWP